MQYTPPAYITNWLTPGFLTLLTPGAEMEGNLEADAALQESAPVDGEGVYRVV